ncbi:MAG: hypothetical protein L0220_07675 [Acidobacteria bacterium]|nr:hypothetical protein [Acidobacteriota bacterium]
MKALIFKDLRQNAGGLLFFISSAILFPTAIYLINAPGPDNSRFVGVIFGFVTFSAPTMFAMWFIGQEKLKGTFRFLKILPISGMRVIVAKSLTCFCICLVTMNVSLIGMPILLRLSGFPISFPTPMLLFWLNLANIFFISLNMLVFTALNHKIASQISLYSMMAVGLGVVMAGKVLAPRGYSFSKLIGFIQNKPGLFYLLGVLIFIFSAAIIRLSGNIFEKAEWPDLEES